MSSSSSSSRPAVTTFESATIQRIRHRDGEVSESATLFKHDGYTAEFGYKSRTTGGSSLALPSSSSSSYTSALPSSSSSHTHSHSHHSHRPSSSSRHDSSLSAHFTLAPSSTNDLTARMNSLRMTNGPAINTRLAGYDADGYDRRNYTGTYRGALTIEREPSRRESTSRHGPSSLSRSSSHRERSHQESSSSRHSRSHSSAGQGALVPYNGGQPAPLVGAGFSQAERHSSSHSHRPSSSGSRHGSSSHHGSSHHSSSRHGHHGHGHTHRPMDPIAEEGSRLSSSHHSSSRSGHTRHIEASGTTNVRSRMASHQ